MLHKIKEVPELLALREAAMHQGLQVVFTNGCFDFLHRGHVQYLDFARTQGDCLIVAVNSDDSVKRLKGPSRPLNTLEDRMIVLAALESVTWVVPFDSSTPVPLIEQLRPDIYVKGADYTLEQLPETPVVRSYGGRVVLAPFLPGHSTTAAVQKMNGG